jgi:hypothetical protein
VLEKYSELGVADEFIAMLGRYLQDSRVNVTEDSDEASHNVVKHLDTEGKDQWGRKTDLSSRYIGQLATTILAVTQEMDTRVSSQPSASIINISHFIRDPDARKKNKVSGASVIREESVEANKILRRSVFTAAVDLAFLETTVDALADCYYMQHRYDHYIPDFNAQYYSAQQTISRDFLDHYADIENASPNYEAMVQADYRNFRGGVALLFLKDILVQRDVVPTLADAAWVVSALAKNYPIARRHSHRQSIEPFNESDIRLRCLNMQPRNKVLLKYVDYKG